MKGLESPAPSTRFSSVSRTAEHLPSCAYLYMKARKPIPKPLLILNPVQKLQSLGATARKIVSTLPQVQFSK